MTILGAALAEAGVVSRPEAVQAALATVVEIDGPNYEKERQRVIMIPTTFTIDGRGLMYYLRSNNVDFEEEIVTCIPDDNTPAYDMREFFFPSEVAWGRASEIWYALTGCEFLGKLNKWQSWEKFK